MRKPNRTTQRRTLFPILHTSRVPPSPSSTNLYSKHHRNPKLFTIYILTPTPIPLLKQRFPLTRMHNSIYSENTTLWPTSLTTKSTCRSPNCRIHSPSSHPPKTRRLRHATNYNTPKPGHRLHSLPVPNTFHMRNNHNQLHLLTSNRPKIPYRILLSQPHGTSNRSCPYPNTMKLYRSNSPNNRSRPNIIYIILPSKLKLRTNPQPYHNPGPRPTNYSTPNSSLMTTGKPHQPSPSTYN